MWRSPGTDAHAEHAGAWLALVHIMTKEVIPALAYDMLAGCIWSEPGQPEQAHCVTLHIVFFP